MKTCRITAEVWVSGELVCSREWVNHDRMRTSSTRGWTRRQFNARLLDLGGRLIGRDKIVTASWRCEHGPPYHTVIEGFLSGVNGATVREDGVFER